MALLKKINHCSTSHQQNAGGRGEQHTVFSTDAGKAFDKIQHPFMRKAPQETSST